MGVSTVGVVILMDLFRLRCVLERRVAGLSWNNMGFIVICVKLVCL